MLNQSCSEHMHVSLIPRIIALDIKLNVCSVASYDVSQIYKAFVHFG